MKRTYRVRGGEKPRMVRASSKAQAVNHVVKDHQYSATVAVQADYEELWDQKIEIEEASEE
jgi:hypothetical protein